MSKNVIMLAFWVLWPVAGAYFALCIGIPEIRPYWSRGPRFGLLSSIGAAATIGGSWIIFALIVTGVLSEKFYSFLYVYFCLGIGITLIGHWIEVAEDSADEERRARRFREKDSF